MWGETLGRISFFRDYGKAVLALDDAICEVHVLGVKRRHVFTAFSPSELTIVSRT